MVMLDYYIPQLFLMQFPWVVTCYMYSTCMFLYYTTWIFYESCHCCMMA